MNIGIIYGGKSGEHEVSLISAASVVRNISAHDHRIYLIAISKNGFWYLQDESLLEEVCGNAEATLQVTENENSRVTIVPGGGPKGAFKCGDTVLRIDVVFPILHGTFGEDGCIQGLFEMADIPYVGAGVMASSLSMDKEKTKMIWQESDLPVVPYKAVKIPEWTDETKKFSLLRKIEENFPYPVFVKPASTGSSVGASKVSGKDELERAMEEAFQWDNKIIIESFIPAREIECSVTGSESPVAYTLAEIIPTHEFYDYEAKYTDPDGASFNIPANIPEETTEKIRTMAIEAYKVLDVTGMARVDFFIDKRDGTIYLNEINTIPGFTSISMFSKMCEASGLPYNELILKLLGQAKAQHDSRKALRTSR
ncbi:D-alanine--D-alanine ligase [Brucepastera parasyntrophica]|uniref:D-alanine--D-alanine ligase family protein n=1 Tax=Brucepastera parasyntrophica TaxID=2880008 RepID=UPI00210ACF50|nr:D-alanine--D-alanine ligase family protein [Brucepastera parasyntrophica]ULQ60524.1 D-alanine--D-alanine ligase [Brucepastera parasyntrophica]